ncbi:MAG: FecR domain-containing protein [Alphaproteobacteria bacterium]|nr:FecR domain-containing protein [Alphaproteobacteria bacterium]
MSRSTRSRLALSTVAFVLLPASALAQATGELAGVAAAVRGDVTLVAAVPATPERVVGRNLGSGDRIFLGDEIETGPESGMQIMLLDETIFTIGPDAGLVIDEFVYDPATSAGKVTASVVKGAFRFVSGRVAKEEPSNMSVKTPVGTIGIRGTSAAGVIAPADPNDPASPLTGTFVLLGPGTGNNAGERAGRILVTNGDTTVEITRSGFGTVIEGPTLPPGTPVRLNPAQVAGLTAALGTDGSARPQQGRGDGQGAGGQGGNNQSGTSSTSTAGPSTRSTRIQSGQATRATGQNIGEGVTRIIAQQRITDDSDNPEELISDPAAIPGTLSTTQVATFDQLRSIQTGTANFNFGTIQLNHESGPHTNSGGSYNATATIDFGAQTIDLNITSVTYFFNGGDNESFVFDPDANGGGGGGALDNTYANDTGAVAETWTTDNDSSNFTTAPTDGASARVEAAILNNVDAGVIAAKGFVKVTIKENGGDTVISGGSLKDRQ